MIARSDSQRIVITGVGLTAPGANHLREFRANLLAGRSGVRKYDIRYIGSTVAGVCEFDELRYQKKKEVRRGTRAGSIGIYCTNTEAYYSPLIRFCALLDNDYAIELWDSRPYIVDNYIARSSRAGVYCEGCSPATLDRNTIVDGQRYGIWVRTDVFCEPYLTTSWVPSNANNIYGNAWCDLCNEVEDQRGLVEARYNYWGSDCPDFESIICGPGRVNYMPWVDSTHTYVYDECPPQATRPSTWGRIKAMFR